MLKKSNATLARQIKAAPTQKRRIKLLKQAEVLAARKPTARGAAGLAAALPYRDVQATAAAEWTARAAALADFYVWATAADAWLASVDRAVVALIPARLWPSAMAASVRKWAKGTGGKDPELVKAAFDAAKASALARTVLYTREHFWVEEWVGWAGPLAAPIAGGTYFADFAAGYVSPLFPLGSTNFAHCRLVLFGFGVDDGLGNLTGHPPGIVLQQCAFDSCADVTALDFSPAFNFSDPAHFTLDTNNAAQTACNLVLDIAAPFRWRIRFTQAITGLYLGGQIHCYKRDYI